MPKNRETQTSVGKALMFKTFDYEIEGQEKQPPHQILTVYHLSQNAQRLHREIKLSDIVTSPKKRMNVFGVENWEGMNLGYSGNVKRLTRAEVILGSWDRLSWNESLLWW